MPRTIFKTKEDWSINTIGFLVGIVLMYTVPPIFSHFLVKNGIIIEAVVTEKHIYGRNKTVHYAYKVDKTEYNGKTVLRKNISVNDTILVIMSARNMNKSCAVCLRRNQATLSASAKRLVVINNLSSDEKKELAERLLADLKKRYWVKTGIEDNLLMRQCGHLPQENSTFR